MKHLLNKFFHRLTNSSDVLKLHIKNIAIIEESVQIGSENGSINITGHEYDLERDFYVIHLEVKKSKH